VLQLPSLVPQTIDVFFFSYCWSTRRREKLVKLFATSRPDKEADKEEEADGNK
jgi:hypothetical protein